MEAIKSEELFVSIIFKKSYEKSAQKKSYIKN